MLWAQKTISLLPKPKGIHLVTDEILNGVELTAVRIGILHLHLLHTSAGICLNEKASPEVRKDLGLWFEEEIPYSDQFLHKEEGFDDMPAHIKSALTNNQISLSVKDSKILLGTWQGIYLFEHRLIPTTRIVIHHFFGEN